MKSGGPELALDLEANGYADYRTLGEQYVTGTSRGNKNSGNELPDDIEHECAETEQKCAVGVTRSSTGHQIFS